MYTVIICSKKIIEDCNITYNAFLQPLIEDGEWTFCEWNHEGDSIEEAVPTLERTVAKYRNWRAIIVNDIEVSNFEELSKKNPFDFAGSIPMPEAFNTVDEIKFFREDKEQAFRKAVKNPMTKLTSWLLGAADSSDIDRESITWDLPQPEDVETYDTVVNEIDRYHAQCNEIMHEHFDVSPQIYNGPSEVVMISERFISGEESIGVRKHLEFEYSTFYEDNMYSRKLRYILYDIHYMNRRKDSDTYFDFLVFLLSFAVGKCPHDVLRPERVYRAKVSLDSDKLSQLCHRYIFKLQETKKNIAIYGEKLNEQKKLKLDNAKAVELFESDVIVPVKIESSFNKGRLRADYSGIKLTPEDPEDDVRSWADQHKQIRKDFSRYSREPQKSVSKAVIESFRNMNSIDDSRALRLSESQKDDIRFRLFKEEENMVRTSCLLSQNLAKYNRRLDDTDRDIRSSMRKRLGRRKAMYSALAGLMAFVLGFIPWGVDVLRNFQGTGRVLGIGIALAGIVLCAAVCLWVMMEGKMKVVGQIKRFNRTMDANINDMEAGLDEVSQYLSHACNVMREFSVLNVIDNDSLNKRKALDMHTRMIDAKLKSVYEKFFKYIDESFIERHKVTGESGEAYDYDFTKMVSYEYDMPYTAEKRTIMYLQSGNIIEIPVDYVREVTLEREELYG